MKHLALYGSHHIQHSLSPYLHQIAAEIAGIKIQYHLLACDVTDFPQQLSQASTIPLTGANVTNPHKMIAYQACDELTQIAQQSRAVNTLWWHEGKMYGDNTDVHGFLYGLHHFRSHYKNHKIEKVLLLGAGGVAQAVCTALSSLRIKEIHVLARSLQKAANVTHQQSANHSNMFMYSHSISTLLQSQTLITFKKSVLLFDLIILATPPLTKDNYEQILTPLCTQAKDESHKGLHLPLIYDLNYGPRSISSKQWAKSLSLPYYDGLMMLAAQGTASFTQWMGKRIDEQQVYQRLKTIKY
jgi:shikimate dehydrogenase